MFIYCGTDTGNGFISTMWDVKLHGGRPPVRLCPAFYLDYVGCKVSKSYSTVRKIYSFYLDYVGCKVRKLISIYLTRFSFISTMWDVKSNSITIV